ncbi:MAG: IclR family transcriptional regulator [Chloroflexota bacterium]
MRDNKVQSVSRAIELIKHVADDPGGVSIGRLAEQTNLHKSTVSRLIMTLEAAGVIYRKGVRSPIQIHPDFAEQFVQHVQSSNLRDVVRPFLEDMSQNFGEAAGLAVPEGDQAVYIDQVTPNSTIQIRDWTGTRFPLHTISAGKLFLANRIKLEQDRYLTLPLASYTENTVTNPVELREAFDEIHQTGVSWIFDEFADGLSGVAAPIIGRDEEVIASLVLFAPSFRFPGQKNIDEINRLMIDYGRRCSADVQTHLITKN